MAKQSTPPPAASTYIDPELQGDDKYEQIKTSLKKTESDEKLEAIKTDILKAKAGVENYRYTPEQKTSILEWIDGGGVQAKLIKTLRDAGIPVTTAGIAGWRKPSDGSSTKRASNAASSKSTSTKTEPEKAEVSLLKVLRGRNFEVRISVDALDPSAPSEIHVEKELTPLLEFIPFYNANGKFELGLNQLLQLLKIPIGKDKHE